LRSVERLSEKRSLEADVDALRAIEARLEALEQSQEDGASSTGGAQLRCGVKAGRGKVDELRHEVEAMVTAVHKDVQQALEQKAECERAIHDLRTEHEACRVEHVEWRQAEDAQMRVLEAQLEDLRKLDVHSLRMEVKRQGDALAVVRKSKELQEGQVTQLRFDLEEAQHYAQDAHRRLDQSHKHLQDFGQRLERHCALVADLRSMSEDVQGLREDLAVLRRPVATQVVPAQAYPAKCPPDAFAHLHARLHKAEQLATDARGEAQGLRGDLEQKVVDLEGVLRHMYTEMRQAAHETAVSEAATAFFAARERGDNLRDGLAASLSAQITAAVQRVRDDVAADLASHRVGLVNDLRSLTRMPLARDSREIPSAASSVSSGPQSPGGQGRRRDRALGRTQTNESDHSSVTLGGPGPSAPPSDAGERTGLSDADLTTRKVFRDVQVSEEMSRALWRSVRVVVADFI